MATSYTYGSVAPSETFRSGALSDATLRAMLRFHRVTAPPQPSDC
jgi:hypothetical protein